MKIKDLKNRLITSIFLIILLYFSFNYSYILIISLILISIISWIEFQGLITKIFIKNNFKSSFLKIIIKGVSLLYLIIFSIMVFSGIFQDNFKFLSTLYKINKLPKVLMFTGNKGSGKATLVNHFLFSIFDEKNYNKTNFSLLNTSILYKEFKNDIFSNIIHLKGSDFNPVKIEDIRFLKKQIFQSTILDKDRFIILDDIELFNANSLNALLKIIEEPSKNNYFFLINNKSRPLLKTIKSRAIENLVYFAASAQGGYHVCGRKTYGNSIIVNPWGETLDTIKNKSGVIISTIDLESLKKLRKSFPCLEHRKF